MSQVKRRRLLGNERGVALPLAMILLVVLTMLTLTFMSLGSVEPQISANLADGTRARQVAESGIEWGFNQLSGRDFNDPRPAEHKVPLRVSMLGTEAETRGVQRRTELLLGEAFEFKEIPEGQYRVVGIYDDRIIWDQRVMVKGGKQTGPPTASGSARPRRSWPPPRWPPAAPARTRSRSGSGGPRTRSSDARRRARPA